MPERDPDNLILWRLAALEESMKHQSSGLYEQANRMDRIEREYVQRSEIRVNAQDSRDKWTLRLLAAGVAANSLLALVTLLVHH